MTPFKSEVLRFPPYPPPNPWMQTFTGLAVDLLAPTREMISIADLAHHLSLECRFGGASRFHYSVAQHSYLAACGAAQCNEPIEVQLELLLHDAHEAYTKDQPSPLSWAVEKLGENFGLLHVARIFDGLIRSMWQLPQEATSKCKLYDMRMLQTEREQLLGPSPFSWDIEDRYEAFPQIKIVQWTPTMAEKTWLLEVKRLTAMRFKKAQPPA